LWDHENHSLSREKLYLYSDNTSSVYKHREVTGIWLQ
jgi:hypothetical protein